MPEIADGETVSIQGSARTPYVLKNVGGVYSCTCPAWRNQSVPIDLRSCKHLKKYRGEAAEAARLGAGANAPAPVRDEGETVVRSGPPLLLAQAWDNEQDLTDWWLSEKLDGVRAYWDGRQFLSRQGNRFAAPAWFTAGLPTVPLDGELWLGRKRFQRTVSVVRSQNAGDAWKELCYVVFDAPALTAPFEDRCRELTALLRASNLPYCRLLEQVPCRGPDHLRRELDRVESLGGEGLMLRRPGSLYEAGRSETLLKLKRFHDDEAVVLRHLPGAGRHRGRMGALLVRLADGTEFSVGTGFSDAQRAAPPAIGTTITFRYQEKTDGGVPRFPSFVRVRVRGDK